LDQHSSAAHLAWQWLLILQAVRQHLTLTRAGTCWMVRMVVKPGKTHPRAAAAASSLLPWLLMPDGAERLEPTGIRSLDKALTARITGYRPACSEFVLMGLSDSAREGFPNLLALHLPDPRLMLFAALNSSPGSGVTSASAGVTRPSTRLQRAEAKDFWVSRTWKEFTAAGELIESGSSGCKPPSTFASAPMGCDSTPRHPAFLSLLSPEINTTA